MHYRKTNKPKLLLMLVALLALFAITIGVTFSWIEGGATYTIQTDDTNAPVKTDSVPQSVTYSGKITLDPTKSTGVIELVNYDENTNQYQNLIFSPVDSADGENFLFPVSNSDGTTAFYREAKVNDIGTKYINYDFEIADTTKKCYVAFDGEPKITAMRGNSSIDTSAFRIMIKCGDDKYIFTTADSNKTTTVATNSGSSVQTLTAVPFTSYINNPSTKANKLFTYEKGTTGNIEVSIWLDNGSDTSVLQGCEITIDMDLVVVAENVTANFRAVSYDKTGTKLSSGFAGGNIRRGNTVHTSNFSVTGTTFTATAVPNTGYAFMGWYSDSACTKLITEELVLPTQSPDADVNYYAKFQERNSTVIYVEPRSGFSTYSIWAYQKIGTDTHHYSGTTWPGESAVLDSATGYYRYEFSTSDTGQFSVIISNNGGSQYPAQNDEGLVGNLGGTYLFTADNTLVEFDPADMITLNAYGKAPGGTASLDGKDSVITRPGKTVVLKATPDSGYKFVGWYKDSAYTTAIDSNSTSATLNLTMTAADAGNTYNYYAKFEKIPTLTLKTSVTPSGGGTAYAGGKTSSTVQIGSSVTLTATPASGYKFVGWYTNSACTSYTGITNHTSTTATYTVSGTANSTVTLYAKFEKSAKTVDVGVIYYLKERSTVTQVYYWCASGTTGTIDLSTLTPTEKSYSLGSSYWSNAAQKFYCYTIEVPDDVTGIKFRNGSNWYGSDVKDFTAGKINLIFEWGGSYINQQKTK